MRKAQLLGKDLQKILDDTTKWVRLGLRLPVLGNYVFLPFLFTSHGPVMLDEILSNEAPSY